MSAMGPIKCAQPTRHYFHPHSTPPTMSIVYYMSSASSNLAVCTACALITSARSDFWCCGVADQEAPAENRACAERQGDPVHHHRSRCVAKLHGCMYCTIFELCCVLVSNQRVSRAPSRLCARRQATPTWPHHSCSTATSTSGCALHCLCVLVELMLTAGW
jgi:hypothetical protein